ncbi:unnamed protein product [Rotaria sp. Silwood2]|nr:unnamed protein product [Rotaria sp. Silwood2]CAF3085017.1 unnamed protein product [Rotaria sp. Silwood2]CAF3390864.1 unnamed protein product [Rotaria sp. Silwood2]CAF4285265.1 unnamed protein product [Rotaria sp. Silwood2]CAF4381193.1 unnamed protein product [Rotaria sp. Silwood2]
MALTNRLRSDAGKVNDDFTQNTELRWRQVYYVFIDYRIYFYALIYTCISAVNKYLTSFLPLLLVDGMGSYQPKVHLMIVPLYVIACIFCLLIAYSSSRWNNHGYHLVLCLVVALLGIILMIALIDGGTVAIYTSICIACTGVLSAFSLVVSWLTNNIDGQTKRPMAVGFIMGIGQIGGIILPLVRFLLIYHDNLSNNRRACCICIGIITVSLIATLVLRYCLMLENRRRDRLTSEQFKREEAIKEPCDWHPSRRYVL